MGGQPRYNGYHHGTRRANTGEIWVDTGPSPDARNWSPRNFKRKTFIIEDRCCARRSHSGKHVLGIEPVQRLGITRRTQLQQTLMGPQDLSSSPCSMIQLFLVQSTISWTYVSDSGKGLSNVIDINSSQKSLIKDVIDSFEVP